MYIIVFTFFLLFHTLHAEDIKPIATLQASGLVSDFVEDAGYLYVATDAGVVDIIDLFSQKIVKHIKFKPHKTMMGDTVPVRIFSIDRHNGKTLMVTSGMSAWRNVWIHDGKQFTKIINKKIILCLNVHFSQMKGKYYLLP